MAVRKVWRDGGWWFEDDEVPNSCAGRDDGWSMVDGRMVYTCPVTGRQEGARAEGHSATNRPQR